MIQMAKGRCMYTLVAFKTDNFYVSWLDHERIRVLIHHQTLHVECTCSKDPRADLVVSMKLTNIHTIPPRFT